ncbi:MAG: DUF1080 domain-containing protein [Verrucomicrobia bacterium]|nr:DUF1080 domain-containing protein [Verrucomicrobiota bacterium]
MKPLLSLAFALGLSLAATLPSRGADSPYAEGFVSMFNGRDLTGWTNINCAPETWSVRDGKIYCTGFPVGGLRTVRQYENFILEVEWRHLKRSGNSGVFIWGSPINAPGVPFLRGIEVQVLDHGYAEDFEKKNGRKADWFTVHGDVFAIHGATMTYVGRTNGKRSFPTEERSKPSPEWNHYRIVANHGSLRLHVNGKEVSGGDDTNYRKGYLALESEGSPIEFRNLRIKELPPTGADASNTAPVDLGWRALFNSVDLRGWRNDAATAARWSVVGEKIFLKPAAPSTGGATGAPLTTDAEFGNAEFIVDFQPPKSAAGAKPPGAALAFRGTTLELAGADGGKFSRFTITVQGRSARVQRDAQPAVEIPLAANSPARSALSLVATGGGGTFMNLHTREL